MQPEQSSFLDFVRQNKLVAFLFLFVVLLIIFVAIASFFLTTSDQKTSPSQSNTLGDITILSTTPKANTQSVSIFPTIQVVFTKPVTTTQQSSLQFLLSPATQSVSQWSPDQKTLFLTPSSPLATETTYTASLFYAKKEYSWSFTTTSVQNTTTIDQQKAQSQADKNYGDWQAEVNTNYPWYDQLPLQTNDYFVYFDLDTKTFVGLLYPNKSAPIDTQVTRFKDEVTKRLQALRVNTQQFTFEWKVTPK